MTFFFSLMFMFLVFWRPQDWLVPWLEGWNILDVIVLAAVASLVVEVSEKKLKMPKSPVPRLLLGLFLASIMSHVAHTYLAGMIDTLKATWKFCFFTYVLFRSVNNPKQLRAIAIMFVSMSCVMAIHALLQKHRGYGFMGGRPIYFPAQGDEDEYVRTLFYGIFEDPNDLAQILATSIPLCFVITRQRNLFSLILAWSLAALLVTANLTTGSRGGMIALAAAGGMMALLVLPSRWTQPLLLLAAVAALALCVKAGPFLDDSARGRVVFWGEANWAFKSSILNILFGVGYGMISEYISKSSAIHNAFVLCYTELGVFGYWFWFNLLMLGVLGCVRTRTRLRGSSNPDHAYLRRLAGASMAAMAGFAASSYFLTRAYVYPLFFLFALLNLVPLVTQSLLPEDSKPLIEPKRDVLIYGSIGTLASIIYVYISILILNKAYMG